MEIPIRTFNLALLGFGNVNRTLAHLLHKKSAELHERGISWRITGVASRRLGWLADVNGLDVEKLAAAGAPARTQSKLSDVREWLREAQADVLFEATSLNVPDGQPAVDHIRAALESGCHAITANKGPIVHAYEELQQLAEAKGKRFLFESTVMDGVPIFSLFRETLPTVQLRGFRGILNSTTNVMLHDIENGMTFEQSVKGAREAGLAETDPSHDVDAWDAAVKVVALVRVLMGVPLKLNEVERQGIRNLSAEEVRMARAEGKPYKLVCRAQREGSRVRASVRPEQVPSIDPFALVTGSSSIIQFETDIFPNLVITENNPGLEATAYGMLADFVKAVT